MNIHSLSLVNCFFNFGVHSHFAYCRFKEWQSFTLLCGNVDEIVDKVVIIESDIFEIGHHVQTDAAIQLRLHFLLGDDGRYNSSFVLVAEVDSSTNAVDGVFTDQISSSGDSLANHFLTRSGQTSSLSAFFSQKLGETRHYSAVVSDVGFQICEEILAIATLIFGISHFQ